MEEGRSASKNLTGKLTGKRPRSRWEDNIRINLKEIGIGLIRLSIRIIREPFLVNAGSISHGVFLFSSQRAVSTAKSSSANESF